MPWDPYVSLCTLADPSRLLTYLGIPIEMHGNPYSRDSYQNALKSLGIPIKMHWNHRGSLPKCIEILRDPYQISLESLEVVGIPIDMHWNLSNHQFLLRADTLDQSCLSIGAKFDKRSWLAAASSYVMLILFDEFAIPCFWCFVWTPCLLSRRTFQITKSVHKMRAWHAGQFPPRIDII